MELQLAKDRVLIEYYEKGTTDIKDKEKSKYSYGIVKQIGDCVIGINVGDKVIFSDARATKIDYNDIKLTIIKYKYIIGKEN